MPSKFLSSPLSWIMAAVVAGGLGTAAVTHKPVKAVPPATTTLYTFPEADSGVTPL